MATEPIVFNQQQFNRYEVITTPDHAKSYGYQWCVPAGYVVDGSWHLEVVATSEEDAVSQVASLLLNESIAISSYAKASNSYVVFGENFQLEFVMNQISTWTTVSASYLEANAEPVSIDYHSQLEFLNNETITLQELISCLISCAGKGVIDQEQADMIFEHVCNECNK